MIRIALLLLLLISTCHGGGPNSALPPIEIDVAIAGAGLAGAEIATLAKQDGKSPVMFESRHTYGGRVQSIDIGGNVLPKGGGWQQGTGRNHALTKRIRECDIRVKGQNWNRWLDFCIDGQECGESWGEFETAFACAEELALELAGTDAISMETGFRLCGWWPRSDDEFLVQDSTVLFEWAEGDSTLGLQTSLPWLTYAVHTDADNFFIDERGAEEMVGCWLDRYGIGREESASVAYNSPVVNINTDTQILTLANGTRYHYSVLFNTLPLGVLQWNQAKEGGSLFTPPLEPSRVLSLYTYHAPVYQKIFLQFPTAFWNDFSPNKEFFNIASSFQHQCSLWQNVDLGNGWLTDSRILYITCTSPQSDYGENIDEDGWRDILMPDLRKVFGEDIPEPLSITVSKWLEDPNFRGTFSNRPVEHTSERFNELFAPFGTDQTHIFTGEAYCENMGGFMHSAILAAETSWCEYKVRIGELPVDTPCRAIATDADGDELPNFCFAEGLEARKREQHIPKRRQRIGGPKKISDEHFARLYKEKLAKALDSVAETF